MRISKLSRSQYRLALYFCYAATLVLSVCVGAGFLWSTVIAVASMYTAHLVLGRIEFGKW